MSDADFARGVLRKLEALDTALLDFAEADETRPRDPSLVRTRRLLLDACKSELLLCDLQRLDRLAVRLLQTREGEWGNCFLVDVRGTGIEASKQHGLIRSRHPRLHDLAELLNNTGSERTEGERADNPMRKRRGGKPALEKSNPLLLQIYERIYRERGQHPDEQYLDTIKRLKADNHFLEQIKDASLRLNSKLVQNAMAFFGARSARNKQ